MAQKTYSRARAAKSVLAKILANHEVEANIWTVELDDNRFTAHADFAPGTEIDALLEEDLEGFSWSRPALEDDDKTAAEVLDEEIAEIRADDTPAEVENPADVPLPKRKSGYVNEVSNFVGVVSYCRETIPALAAKGMTRKQIIDELRSRGVAYGTARTQYQNWFSPPKIKTKKEEE